MKPFPRSFAFFLFGIGAAAVASAENKPQTPARLPNPDNFQQWILPKQAPWPANNAPTPERIELGKMLFFDPRLSRNGTTSCATCHNPGLGWADGLVKGRGFKGEELGRHSPSIINTAYNTIQMWDGRKKDLEDQALGPMESAAEMNVDFAAMFAWLNASPGYKQAFAKAYPGEPINASTLSRAIASFERTVVSRTSPFDRWLAKEKNAMTAQQLRGFMIFNDPAKGNCVVCHSAPNFTDNGFHNIGLTSFGDEKPDDGRFAQKAVKILKGAFKTPGLRDIAATPPYFHDGSAKTLGNVMDHYVTGGVVRSNLSPNIKPLVLDASEKEDLIAFLQALSSPPQPLLHPVLPPH